MIVFGMVSWHNQDLDSNRYKITATSPVVRDITETVTLYGTVTEEGRQTLYAKGKAYIQTVYVTAGDLVSAGDPLISLRPIGEEEQQSLVYRDAEMWISGLYRDGVTNQQNIQSEVQSVFNRFIVAQNKTEMEQNAGCYTLYSPIDGMVVSVSGKVGDAITEYFPAAIVTDLNQLSVRSEVTENILKIIKIGNSCSISVSALSGYNFVGKIRYISPYAYETNLLSGGGTYVTEVIIDFEHGRNALRPGYQATAKVQIGTQNDVVMIPYDAVAQDEDGREYVMIWTGKQAYRKDIVTGKEIDEFVQVLSGITEDHRIIRNVNQISFTERTVLYEVS